MNENKKYLHTTRVIHEGTVTSYIARKYYEIVCPERKYDNRRAIVQWNQDKKIDKKVLLKVLNTIHKEAKELLR